MEKFPNPNENAGEPETPESQPAGQQPEKQAAAREPVLYEKILEAATTLHENFGDPAKRAALEKSAWDMEDEWRKSTGLNNATKIDSEKIKKAIAGATLWIDAGFDSARAFRRASDELGNWQRRLSMTEDARPEDAEAIQDAINRLQAREAAAKTQSQEGKIPIPSSPEVIPQVTVKELDPGGKIDLVHLQVSSEQKTFLMEKGFDVAHIERREDVEAFAKVIMERLENSPKEPQDYNDALYAADAWNGMAVRKKNRETADILSATIHTIERGKTARHPGPKMDISPTEGSRETQKSDKLSPETEAGIAEAIALIETGQARDLRRAVGKLFNVLKHNKKMTAPRRAELTGIMDSAEAKARAAIFEKKKDE